MGGCVGLVVGGAVYLVVGGNVYLVVEGGSVYLVVVKVGLDVGNVTLVDTVLLGVAVYGLGVVVGNVNTGVGVL